MARIRISHHFGDHGDADAGCYIYCFQYCVSLVNRIRSGLATHGDLIFGNFIRPEALLTRFESLFQVSFSII
jgi:hypothetical protein